MKSEQFLFPATIIGAVGALVYLFRNSGGNPPTVTNIPNTTQSGATYQAHPQTFAVQVPSLAPSPAANFAPPYFGGNSYGDITTGPNVFTNDDHSVRGGSMFDFHPQTYNFASGAKPDSTPLKQPSSGGCGCGNSCESCASNCNTNQSRYPDGHGGCMAYNQGTQINSFIKRNPNIWQWYGDNMVSAGAIVPPTYTVPGPSAGRGPGGLKYPDPTRADPWG